MSRNKSSKQQSQLGLPENKATNKKRHESRMYDDGNYPPSKEVKLPLIDATNGKLYQSRLNVGGPSQEVKRQDLKAINKKRNKSWMYDGGNYPSPSKEVQLSLIDATNNYMLNVGGPSQQVKLQDLRSTHKKRNESRMYDGGNYPPPLKEIKLPLINATNGKLCQSRLNVGGPSQEVKLPEVNINRSRKRDRKHKEKFGTKEPAQRRYQYLVLF